MEKRSRPRIAVWAEAAAMAVTEAEVGLAMVTVGKLEA